MWEWMGIMRNLDGQELEMRKNWVEGFDEGERGVWFSQVVWMDLIGPFLAHFTNAWPL
jgi:hypothetical protein